MDFPESKSVAWKVVEEILGISFSAAATGTPSASTSFFGDGSWKSTPTASGAAWTPIDSSGAGLTFTSASGTYIRHGNLIAATGNVLYPVTADASDATIGGLPVAVASGLFPVCATVTTCATAIVIAGTGTLAVPFASAGGAHITNATLSANIIYFTLVYEA